ncbi:MAG: hypothetical protein WDO18_00020 [Acidobacteriota bacterium]
MSEEFLDLLTELRAKDQLPPEVHLLEIGVGSGSRCAQWLDIFQEADQRRGTEFYPLIRFNMGDYSNDTLDKARPAVARHINQCNFIPTDAVNPIKTLSHLRHKVMQVHLTNVYDNLPDEEVVRRDGMFISSKSVLMSLWMRPRRCATNTDSRSPTSANAFYA